MRSAACRCTPSPWPSPTGRRWRTSRSATSSTSATARNGSRGAAAGRPSTAPRSGRRARSAGCSWSPSRRPARSISRRPAPRSRARSSACACWARSRWRCAISPTAGSMRSRACAPTVRARSTSPPRSSRCARPAARSRCRMRRGRSGRRRSISSGARGSSQPATTSAWRAWRRCSASAPRSACAASGLVHPLGGHYVTSERVH